MEEFYTHSLHARVRRHGAASSKTTGWMLDDPLLQDRRRSMRAQLRPSGSSTCAPTAYGFYKFCDWLPGPPHAAEALRAHPSPTRARGWPDHLGPENLYITFNGYYPELSARRCPPARSRRPKLSRVCARVPPRATERDAGGGLGRQYGPRLRQGMLRQPHSNCCCRCLTTISRPSGSSIRSTPA